MLLVKVEDFVLEEEEEVVVVESFSSDLKDVDGNLQEEVVVEEEECLVRPLVEQER